MRAFAFSLSLAALCAGAALAQESGLIIDRDRADRVAPGTDATTRDVARDAPEATPLPDVPEFVLQSVAIEGSSQPGLAEGAVAPLIGGRFDGATVHEIVDAIAGAYAASDVALFAVDLPQQDFASGHVRVRVREGHVAGVSINGETDGDLELLRHYAAALTEERPLSRQRMERQLSLISDIPGLDTRVTMSQPDQDNGVRLGLQLDRRPWAYELGVNNNGSRALGRTQLSAVIVRNGAFRLGDETRLSLASDAGFDRFWLAALSHRRPIGYRGLSVTASIRTLRTEPEGGAEGQADAAGILLRYPLVRSFRHNLTVSFGFDGLNSDNANLGELIASERTRVLRASAAYVGSSARRTLVLSAAASGGLDGLGASSLEPSTALDFTKLNLRAGYTRSFGEALVMRLSAAGQASDDPLPASERFALGGAEFGRAFAAASASGDHGYGASAELGWRVRRARLNEAYVFTDGGVVETNERVLAPSVRRDLASAGLGARFRIGRETALDLELAHSLNEPAPGAEPEGWRFGFGFATRL